MVSTSGGRSFIEPSERGRRAPPHLPQPFIALDQVSRVFPYIRAKRIHVPFRFEEIGKNRARFT